MKVLSLLCHSQLFQHQHHLKVMLVLICLGITLTGLEIRLGIHSIRERSLELLHHPQLPSNKIELRCSIKPTMVGGHQFHSQEVLSKAE